MDPVSLAATAATTIVTLLATDAWGTVKEKIGALWRRFRPHEADAVEAELAQAHDEAAVADAAITRAQALYWESRLVRLLASDNAVAAELARVIEELAAPGKGQPAGSVTQHAKASDHSMVIQVGGSARLGALPAIERDDDREAGP